MSTDTELGVWSFKHYVLYLCAIIERLHPEVAGAVRAIIDAGRRAVREGGPTDLRHLRIHEPPSDWEKWNAIERIADEIIGIVQLSQTDPEADEEEYRSDYSAARCAARSAEDQALQYLDMDELVECALAAFENYDPDRGDAAVAAMRVGHYDIALDILTRDADG